MSLNYVAEDQLYRVDIIIIRFPIILMDLIHMHDQSSLKTFNFYRNIN
jgi:hypothetical protein